MDQLIEDARRLFLAKNKDEDLQKAAFHASRAAQIARRNELLTTEEGAYFYLGILAGLV